MRMILYYYVLVPTLLHMENLLTCTLDYMEHYFVNYYKHSSSQTVSVFPACMIASLYESLLKIIKFADDKPIFLSFGQGITINILYISSANLQKL